jgi:hypothetical protein
VRSVRSKRVLQPVRQRFGTGNGAKRGEESGTQSFRAKKANSFPENLLIYERRSDAVQALLRDVGDLAASAGGDHVDRFD